MLDSTRDVECPHTNALFRDADPFQAKSERTPQTATIAGNHGHGRSLVIDSDTTAHRVY
ncbi:MAG: hypothetical protein QM784_35050 [Polyangiaceae bacterium]